MPGDLTIRYMQKTAQSQTGSVLLKQGVGAVFDSREEWRWGEGPVEWREGKLW